MTEAILVTLVGGPADGKQMSWIGGDTIQFRPTPAVDFSKPIEEMPTDATVQIHLYKIDTRPQSGGGYLARWVKP
jgi:hypothetical protein